CVAVDDEQALVGVDARHVVVDQVVDGGFVGPRPRARDQESHLRCLSCECGARHRGTAPSAVCLVWGGRTQRASELPGVVALAARLDLGGDSGGTFTRGSRARGGCRGGLRLLPRVVCASCVGAFAAWRRTVVVEVCRASGWGLWAGVGRGRNVSRFAREF